ncbi:MAG: glycogen/starch/alpha-glucan phosphorylase, partial [Oscillospiraceae bacterium]|nr:glycogen/starch/alpha-glucan phosphorylase [Oscillospiraceae bacterium]
MSYDVKRIVQGTEAMLKLRHDETLQETTPQRLHECLSEVLMMELNDNWTNTKRQQLAGRRAFYFSAEYLVGRLVNSNLLNMGILDEVKNAFAEKGIDLNCFEEIEDAALGNGGLGRLAACFMDSAATCALPLVGYGLRYRFGLFKQTFENGRQRENADDWTKYGDPWSHRRDRLAVKVNFADQTVIAVPYDMPVIGYGNNTINTLRMWQCEAEKELDFDAFNAQDYVRALEMKNRAEDITRVLYPNDSTWEGKRLRIKQQYVLSSASLQDILRDFKLAHGEDLSRLPEFVTIQLNDTHPAMSIPELIRLLGTEGIDFESAVTIASRVFCYTNHTVMQEALEKWDMELLRSVVPEICDILEQIDRRLRNEHPDSGLYIINCGTAHMANLSVYLAHAVNGVAEIHSEILKNDLFRDWYRIYPERFQNKTNGITPRRWLGLC